MMGSLNVKGWRVTVDLIRQYSAYAAQLMPTGSVPESLHLSASLCARPLEVAIELGFVNGDRERGAPLVLVAISIAQAAECTPQMCYTR